MQFGCSTGNIVRRRARHLKGSDPHERDTNSTSRCSRISYKMEARMQLQSDWYTALRENEGEVWVSCKIPGKPTVYGSLKCQGVSHDRVPEIIASEEFEVLEVSKKGIHLSCPSGRTSSKFIIPHTSYSRIHDKSITCLDISCGGGLGVSTSTDGSMKIWNCQNGDRRRELTGHVYDVNCCRFFPRVTERVSLIFPSWTVGEMWCLVHGMALPDCGIVGNRPVWRWWRIVVLLSMVAVWARLTTASIWEHLKSAQVFEFLGSDAFNCCAFLSSVYIVAGAQDGNIYQLDVRCLSTPVQVFHKSGAPVHSILPIREGFIASQGDGGCFLIQQDLDHTIELTGPDTEPIYKVASWEKFIFTCCRDGLVRKYQLSNL
ncbi:hypothetical protein AAFF_G00038570 [Aldrovandia affinis]|uniref:Proteasomal ATPase-associated factor 1 n=1 Tax=Aldrovandia affinis TaxID=143900 RepID=A0AAD7T5H9_9TELE|nr:hypothetical protein AAFF_G00038570 [Aldrovandia affinis]